MSKPKITAGRYTVTTNTDDANDETYQNWRTFRVTRYGRGTYNVSVLSNVGGNGQTWDAIGTIEDNFFRINELAAHATPFSFDTLLLTCVSLLCDDKGVSHNCNAIGTFGNSRVWKIKKGDRITAAPSLLRPGSVRDRNENNAVKAARRNANDLMNMGETKAPHLLSLFNGRIRVLCRRNTTGYYSPTTN